MTRLKLLLGFGRVGGIDDIVGRAVKAATQVFIGAMGLGLTPLMDVSVVRAAAFAGASAAVSVIENALLKWSQS